MNPTGTRFWTKISGGGAVFAALTALADPTAARASISDCNGTSDAPNTWHNDACNAGETTDICTLISGLGVDEVECDLATNGDTTSGLLHAVTNYSGSSPLRTSIWGNTALGNGFCCLYDDPDTDSHHLIDVIIYAGDNGSTIRLDATNGSSLHFDGATHASALGATVYGGTDVDVVYGSPSTANSYTNYQQYLYGGPGGDTLNCNTPAGVGCTADGQDGADTVIGGDGDDDLHGENANDTVCGGGCDFGDDLFGGSENDTLWTDCGHSNIDAGPGSNSCGNWSNPNITFTGTCSTHLTTKPAACP